MALGWVIKLKSRLQNNHEPRSIIYRCVFLSCLVFQPLAGRWRHWRVSRRMTSSQGLHLKTYVLILFIILFAPMGNVLLSKGMKNVGAVAWQNPESLGHIFVQIFTSPYVWLGIGSLLLFFIAYLLVLSWADYSFVQPASATSYAVVALLGHFALKETISPMRWLGVLVICSGVLVVGNTHPRTTEHK